MLTCRALRFNAGVRGWPAAFVDARRVAAL
jgi:hypothetical protein